MKRHNSPLITLLFTTLLLIGATGLMPHPVMSQESSPAQSSETAQNDSETNQNPAPSNSNNEQTLSPSDQESNAQVSNLTDGTSNGLAIAAAIGALLSLGANLWLYLRLQKLQRLRTSSESVPNRGVEDPLKHQVIKLKDDVKKLSQQQATFAQQLNQQSQQQISLAQPDRAPQGYGSREQIPSRYSPPPVSASPQAYPPQSYPQSGYVSESHQPLRSRSESFQASPASISPYATIVQNYNSNAAVIASTAEGVSETEDSLYRRRRDSSITQVSLQRVSNYSYWVVVDADHQYWLVPKSDLKLNSMNFDTFQSLFEFQGHPSEGRLSLMKPAKVNQSNTSGEWELMERGEVQFV